MLANLLPGLRDARTPLASGLMWLVLIAVSTSWLLPELNESLLFQQLSVVTASFGGAVWLTILSFAGYLLGMVVATLPVVGYLTKVKTLSPTSAAGINQAIVREIRAARRRQVPFYEVIEQFDELRAIEFKRMSADEREEYAAVYAAEHPGTTRSLSEIILKEQWDWLETEPIIELFAKRVVNDLDLAELSLQAKNRDLYDKYDRMEAEGEFRRAVALPLGLLSVAVAIRCGVEFHSFIPVVILVGAIGGWVLWRSGERRQLEARDFMVQAVLGGQASSATLKLISDLQPDIA